MPVIAVDASALLNAILDGGPEGDAARSRLSDEGLVAPHLIDLEAMSTLKRLERSKTIDSGVVETTLQALGLIPMIRLPSFLWCGGCGSSDTTSPSTTPPMRRWPKLLTSPW